MDQPYETVEKYLQLKRENISILRFILEGYEGLATATTIDKNRAIVKLFIMPDFVKDVSALIASLKAEMDLADILDRTVDVDGGKCS